MRTIDPEHWYKKLNKNIDQSSWIPACCGPFEKRLRASFKDAFKEFWLHSITPALRNINDRHRIRWYYGLLRLYLVAWGLSVMAYMSVDFQNRPPLQFNDQKSKRQESSVDFPAIAICSNTLITHKALDNYAEILARSKVRNSTYSYSSIRSNLMKLGNLITLSWPEPDMEFMRFVYDVDPHFNVTNVMFKFAARCTHMLRRCAWSGHIVDCARLFSERPTPFGFCCVFNSRYLPIDVGQPSRRLRLLGPNYGLVVVVNEDPTEAALSRRPRGGFDVLMFDGAQYPLLESGLVRLLLASRNESIFFPLIAHSQHPSDSLKYYTEKWKQCRLRQLDGRTRDEYSSYVWCITECRRRTIAALCNCLPFTLFPNATDKTCSPEHLPCLTKHREKLLFFYPGGTHPRLERERQDSQMCQHCMPDCARHWHTTVPYHTSYHYPKKISSTIFRKRSNVVSLVNTTILRFYYQTLAKEELTVEISVRWYEAFALMSCQARLLLGLSLLTLLELVYFLTVRWCYHFLRRSRRRAVRQYFNRNNKLNF